MERLSRARVCILGCTILCCWLAISCSSSKAPQTALHFISPTQSPTIDYGESVTLTLNQSATWTLQSGCGSHQTPAGSFFGGVLTTTGNAATYVVPNPPTSSCTSPDLVVAAEGNQTAELTVILASPPQIANASAFSYTGVGCNSGTTCCPQPQAGTPLIIYPGASQVAGSSPAALQINVAATLGAITLKSSNTGVPPYTWQVVAGSLPPGLQLTPQTGITDGSKMLLQGTPTTIGCFNFTLQLADATAPSNCNISSSVACTQSTPINVVVLPASLKVQAPNYVSSLNDSIYNTFYSSQTGDQGVPYPPTALTVTNGQGPFFWCQDPLSVSLTLPGGLLLDSIQQPNFNCATSVSSVSSSSYVVLSGAPGSGSESTGNTSATCNGSSGCYNTQFQVYDNESPYPAVGLVNLGHMQDFPLVSCSQANAAPPLGTSSEAYLQGPVAFLLRGFDDASSSAAAIAGSVTLDGAGNVTGGTIDVTRASGHQQLKVVAGTNSWYVIGTRSYSQGQFGLVPPPPPNLNDYSRGCMTLALVDAVTGTAAPAASFSFTLGGCSNHFAPNQFISTSQAACGQNSTTSQPLGFYTTGRIIEFDDHSGSGTRASGILRAQDTSNFTNGLSGPYAFGLSGGDSTQKHYAMAGSLQANSGSFSAVAADINDGGACGSNTTCNVNYSSGSGSYTADSAFGSTNGRWTGTLSPSAQTSFKVAGYTVSSSEALIITTDQLSATQPIIGGEAITTASSFSTASLQNSHMLRIGGLSSPAGPDVSIGVLNFDGVGGITGTIFLDQAATIATTTVSASYQVVDQNSGRTVFNAPSQGQTIGAHSFVGYLIPPASTLTRQSCGTAPESCVTGFLIGTDNTAQSGVLEFQTSTNPPPPPFSNLYVAGNYAYGTDEGYDGQTPYLDGDVFATPTSSSTTSGSLGPNSQSSWYIQDVSYSPLFAFNGVKNYYCPSASNCYLLQPNQAVGGSYTVTSNGIGTFGGGVVSVTNGNVVFFIDESPVDGHPSIKVAEQ